MTADTTLHRDCGPSDNRTAPDRRADNDSQRGHIGHRRRTWVRSIGVTVVTAVLTGAGTGLGQLIIDRIFG